MYVGVGGLRERSPARGAHPGFHAKHSKFRLGIAILTSEGEPAEFWPPTERK